MQKLKYFFRNPLQLLVVAITKIFPSFGFIYETKDYQCYVNFEFWLKQKTSSNAENRKAYWPVHFTSTVFGVDKIEVGVDAYPGIMGGCYITGRGGLKIGDYTQIAPNVVIVTANHDIYDTRKFKEGPVIIGKYCWIGAGAKIMPGVTLGDWTIVAAGAVVTKSYCEGYCILAGVPAIEIKKLDKEKCLPFENKIRYRGYIPEREFDEYRKNNLNF